MRKYCLDAYVDSTIFDQPVNLLSLRALGVHRESLDPCNVSVSSKGPLKVVLLHWLI